MHLVSLALTDFRNLAGADIELDPEGTTVITGLNGAGKTSLLEATAYLATLDVVPRLAQGGPGTPGGGPRHPAGARRWSGDRTLTIEAEVLGHRAGPGPRSTGRSSAGAPTSTKPCG